MHDLSLHVEVLTVHLAVTMKEIVNLNKIVTKEESPEDPHAFDERTTFQNLLDSCTKRESRLRPTSAKILDALAEHGNRDQPKMKLLERAVQFVLDCNSTGLSAKPKKKLEMDALANVVVCHRLFAAEVQMEGSYLNGVPVSKCVVDYWNSTLESVPTAHSVAFPVWKGDIVKRLVSTLGLLVVHECQDFKAPYDIGDLSYREFRLTSDKDVKCALFELIKKRFPTHREALIMIEEKQPLQYAELLSL